MDPFAIGTVLLLAVGVGFAVKLARQAEGVSRDEALHDPQRPELWFVTSPPVVLRRPFGAGEGAPGGWSVIEAGPEALQIGAGSDRRVRRAEIERFEWVRGWMGRGHGVIGVGDRHYEVRCPAALWLDFEDWRGAKETAQTLRARWSEASGDPHLACGDLRVHLGDAAFARYRHKLREGGEYLLVFDGPSSRLYMLLRSRGNSGANEASTVGQPYRERSPLRLERQAGPAPLREGGGS